MHATSNGHSTQHTAPDDHQTPGDGLHEAYRRAKEAHSGAIDALLSAAADIRQQAASSPDGAPALTTIARSLEQSANYLNARGVGTVDKANADDQPVGLLLAGFIFGLILGLLLGRPGRRA
ncbi:MAG: hypothetical protein ACOCYT_02090 [Chloroflexota bacterium]